MKSLHTHLITAGLLLGLSGFALAQTAPAPSAPRAERSEKMREHMAHRHSQHLLELKSKLKLQPGQEAAWTAFEQSMHMPKDGMGRTDRAALEKLSTPERLDQMQTHRAQMNAQMDKHMEATKTLYGSLNAEQKKVFDAETVRGMRHMGSEGQHHRH